MCVVSAVLICGTPLALWSSASFGATGGQATLSPDVLKKMVETQGGAVLGGLDKVTARVSKVYAPLDVPVQFGSLQITVRKCNKRPPEETPEQTVFLEINDIRADHSSNRVFTGWMFWSSPARNALEHPVYDVWLKDCVTLGSAEPAPVAPEPDMFEPGVTAPTPAPAPSEPAPAAPATPGEGTTPTPDAPLSPRLLPPG